MRLPLFQIDAFAERVFQGNPAAVCPLEAWLPEALMQAIAAENNLSETAFCVPEGESYGLRWFTPQKEIDLCGHATLASAHTLWETGTLQPGEQARFHTLSGLLTAEKKGDWIELNFPAKLFGVYQFKKTTEEIRYLLMMISDFLCILFCKFHKVRRIKSSASLRSSTPNNCKFFVTVHW